MAMTPPVSPMQVLTGMGGPPGHRPTATWRCSQRKEGFPAWKAGLGSRAYSNSFQGRSCMSSTPTAFPKATSADGLESTGKPVHMWAFPA